MARGDLRTKISLEGGDAVRRQLEQIGQAGEVAANRLSQSLGGPAGPAGAFATLTSAIGAQSHALGLLRERFQGFGGAVRGAVDAIIPLGRFLGPAGIVGLAAGATAAIRKTTGALTELRNIGLATGFAPTDVKVFQEFIEATGANTEVAGRSLVRFADTIGEARLQTQGLTSELAQGVAVMRGSAGAASEAARGVVTMRGALSDATGAAQSLVKVFRGGQTAEQIKSLSDPLKVLGIDLRNFTNDAEGNKKVLIEVGKRLAELRQRDAALATSVGAEFFGRQFQQLAEALDRISASGAWDQVERGVRDTGRAPTPEALAKLKDYEMAWDDLGDAIESAQMRATLPTLPAITTGISQIPAIIDELDAFELRVGQFGDRMRGALSDAAESVSAAIASAVEQVVAFADGAVDRGVDLLDRTLAFVDQIVDAAADSLSQIADQIADRLSLAFDALRDRVGAVFDWINSQISAVSGFLSGLRDQIAGVASSIGSGIGSLFGFASGGRVPGSGTGDTVPALLTPGEYVIRRSAVALLGPGFLATLNAFPERFVGAFRGFAAGGLIDRLSAPLMMPQVPRFAAGGLVTAPDAEPRSVVHLHIGGRDYELTGRRRVVDELAREARRAAMLSGGPKPGWMG